MEKFITLLLRTLIAMQNYSFSRYLNRLKEPPNKIEKSSGKFLSIFAADKKHTLLYAFIIDVYNTIH